MASRQTSAILILSLTWALLARVYGSVNLTEVEFSAPDESRFLIFDVRGKLADSEVASAFASAGIEILYGFKAYGGRRFIVVTENDQNMTTSYGEFDLPAADDVFVHPAEFWGDFMTFFNPALRKEHVEENEYRKLPDKNLLLCDCSVSIDGTEMTADEVQNMFAENEEAYRHTFDNEGHTWHLTGRYPGQVWTFRNIEDFRMDRILQANLPMWGSGEKSCNIIPLVNMK